MSAPAFSHTQLAGAFEALLRAMPDRKTLAIASAENADWLSEAAALAMMFDPVRAIIMRGK